MKEYWNTRHGHKEVNKKDATETVQLYESKNTTRGGMALSSPGEPLSVAPPTEPFDTAFVYL